MVAQLRAGVVGAGVFGGYHAAKYAERSDTSLTGVLDPHPDRARGLAERFGARAFADLDELLSNVDVVSIAAPAQAHAALAVACLRAGKPVYVEKPLATSLADADAIGAEARRRGLVVACGFLERAAFRAMRLFDIPEPPLFMQAVRRGPPSTRSLDVSVVIDLMIHDLDLALALARRPALAVEASGACEVNDLLDVVEAEVVFDDGFTASLAASRVAQSRERSMRLVYGSGEIVVDFLDHTFSNSTSFDLDPMFEQSAAARDRLGASLGSFLAAVRGDCPAPLADAADGARALDLALAVERAVQD
jgi:predicted dehydrogenase